MQEQNQTEEFDINNPALAEEGAGIEGFDPNADSNAPPRPPKAGTYLVQLNFHSEKQEEWFVYGSKDDPAKNQVRTQLVGTIVGCEDVAYEEKHWINRKIGGRNGFMVGSWAVRGQKGTSWIGDLLKAYGLKPADMRSLSGAGGPKHWKDTDVEQLITNCILSGQPVRCYLDWEFTGTTKELVNPETGKGYFLQNDYKDDQLKNIPQGMRHANDDGKGGKDHRYTFHYEAPDGSGEEDVQLYANLKVERFMPPKRS